MVKISIKKGLNIPIEGSIVQDRVIELSMPDKLALDLSPFFDVQFNFLAKPGSFVKIGDIIASDKKQPDKVFISPACGTIQEIQRGEKRRPLKVVVDVQGEQHRELAPPSLDNRENVLRFLSSSGFLSHVKKRPGNTYPDPCKLPEAIFIKALETAPFMPTAEMQVQGYEKEFEKGVEVLSSLSEQVHLVYHKSSKCLAFTENSFARHHLADGPFPICLPSLHIYHIYPIMNPSQVVWSLDVLDVITLGVLFLEGKYHVRKVIGRCGDILPEKERRFLKSFRGYPIKNLISQHFNQSDVRILSGNPLTGSETSLDGFLGFFDYNISLLAENKEREWLHFLGLGAKKYSATKAYCSGLFSKKHKRFSFSTNQHGENRAFVESDIYQDVMPMDIPVMDLIKAIMAEDFEKAIDFGLLEIAPEDFILPTFICPSKIEMYQIVRDGLSKFMKEYAVN